MNSSRSSVLPTRKTVSRATTAATVSSPSLAPRTPYSSSVAALWATTPGGYAADARKQRITAARRATTQQGGHTVARGLQALRRLVGRDGDSAVAATLKDKSSSETKKHRGHRRHRKEDALQEDRDDVLSSLRQRGPRGRPLVAPLQPGQVIRDFPFFTQNAEVQYFSTHPSLLDDVFGLHHGQRVRFSRGAWAGQEGSVVGARGSAVWVLLDAESIARELLIPAAYAMAAPDAAAATVGSHAHLSLLNSVDQSGSSDSESNEVEDEEELDNVSSDGAAQTPLDAVRLVRRALHRRYGLEVALSSETQSNESEFPFPTELRQAAEAQAARLFTPAQRAFLQCAPDVFISVVDDDDDAENDEDVVDAQHDDSAELSFYQRTLSSMSAATLSTPSNPHHPQSGRVVFLSPRVLSASGTLGWGGEGAVVVNAGGVHAFTASMSAALVV